MDFLKMREDETEIDFKKRITYGKLRDKTVDLDYSEIAPLVFDKPYSSDVCRRMLYGARFVFDLYEDGHFNNITENDILQQIDEKTRDLKKERSKLGSEKVEYNAWIREQARAELFEEKVISALQDIPKIEVPKHRIEHKSKELDVIVGYSDTHVGTEFKIQGLKGDIINEYNTTIFEKRMWDLLNRVVKNLERDNLKHINLVDGGDCIDGILHLGQLKSLRMGIVESMIYYSTFIRDWLNELSKYTLIDFYPSLGNHSDLRILSGKKGDFPHENIEFILPWFLQDSLKDNPNIKIHDSIVNGLNYFKVVGFDVLTTHGQDEKKLENSLKEYAMLYDVNIDYMITGHKHSKFEHNVGINKNIIQLPSIVGVDDFSIKIKKSANPGAKMMVLEQDYGSIVDYNIQL